MSMFLKPCFLKLLEGNLKNANQIRCYARWSHRHPRRVLTSEEYEKLEENTKNIKSNEYVQNQEEKVIELNSDMLQQTQLKHKWKPQGLQKNLTLVDMDELDQKSVNCKIQPKEKKKKATYKIPKKTDTKTSTDMLETVIDATGDFIYTKMKDNDPIVGQLLLTVKSRNEQVKKDLALLEGKRLIKDALEAGCILKTLIFSRKNDVEFLKPYLPKSGAKLYKMPYREIQMWSDLTTTPGIMGIFKTPDVENFVPQNFLPLIVICDNIREPGNLGAVLRTAAGVGAQNVLLTKGCVDLWDTKVLRSACGAHFRMQIHKKVEWLDIKKQLRELRSSVFIADNRIVSPNSASFQDDNLTIEKLENLNDVISSLPLLPYYGFRFNDVGSLALIVGGETEGISEESYRLAADYNGIRLNIPLNNNIESLNTGTALGVIMFEIKRQMLLSHNTNRMEMSGE